MRAWFTIDGAIATVTSLVVGECSGRAVDARGRAGFTGELTLLTQRTGLLPWFVRLRSSRADSACVLALTREPPHGTPRALTQARGGAEPTSSARDTPGVCM